MREQSKILVAFTALAWVLAGMPGIGAELKYEPKLTYAPTDPIVTGTPLILGNPETTVVKEHSKAEFNVQADSPDPLVFPQLSYQWQRRGPGLTNFLDIEGATKSTYGIAHASTKDVAYYRVQVSSAIGKSTSLPAQVMNVTTFTPCSPLFTERPCAFQAWNVNTFSRGFISASGIPLAMKASKIAG